MRMTIDITNEASAALLALSAELGDLTATNKRIAAAEENFFRDYLRSIASRRHATARRLGAQPTGFFERAAESPEGTADRTGATITVSPRSAFARAFGDVEIKPGPGKRYLTIPVAAAAYGRRAGEFGGGLVFIRTGPGKVPVLAKAGGDDGILQVMYLLVKKVTQKQQRELLPSDEAIAATAIEEIEDHLIETFNKGGRQS